MEWNVKNAINRDVERQQLNKILKDIESQLESLKEKITSSSGSSDVRDIIGGMVSNNIERGINVTYDPVKNVLNFVVPPPPVVSAPEGSEEGDDSGPTTPQTGYVKEAPLDGAPYIRRDGSWQQMDNRLDAMRFIEGPGLLAITSYDDWEVRVLQGVAGEIDVTFGDGEDSDPTVGLSDVENTGGGSLIRTRFDTKGRLIGSSGATTNDLAEGGSNLYFTASRVEAVVNPMLDGLLDYEALKDSLVAGANITLTPDDLSETITITSSGGGGGGSGTVDTVTGGPGISVDNTDASNPIVSVSASLREGVATIALEAAETIHNNRAVLVESDTIRHPAIAAASDGSKILGITRQSGSTSDPVLVQTAGPVTNGSWSWTTGPVYATDEGVLSQTAPTMGWVVSVGKAINSTTIEIDISLPIIRS